MGVVLVIRFALFFDGEYKARFRDRHVDTIRKVPDQFWRDLGHRPPTKDEPKFEKLAMQWAARECASVKADFAPKHLVRHKKTFAQTWELYKRENPDEVAKATITRDQVSMNAIGTFLEHIGRPEIVPEEIDIVFATKFRNWRTGVSKRTLWNDLVFMKQICNFAFSWQSATRCEAVRLIKLPHVELPEQGGIALTEEEFGRVIEKAGKQRDREIAILGVTTRLRRKNLLGLRGEFFDRDRRWLQIDRATMKGGRRKMRRDLSVPVADWTLDQVGDRTAGLLWPSEKTGRALVWVEDIVAQLASNASVRAFTLHDLRTTGNSWLDAAGVDKMTQRHLLGHAEPADVTDIYRRKFEPELRAAVDVFDQIRRRNRW